MGFKEFSGGRPRKGQWCKFRLTSADAAAKLRAAGAHETPDGYFVAVYAPATNPVKAHVTRPDGSAAGEAPGDSPALPPRLMVQTAGGYNAAAVYHDPKTGAHELRFVWFAPDSPEIDALHPMTDKGHFPPGYVARTFAGPHAHLYRDPLP